MQLTDLELLRLHIEAVWSIQLPLITEPETLLLPTRHQPDWKLYLIEMSASNERICLWRSDVLPSEREILLAHTSAALAAPTTEKFHIDGYTINREVVLCQTAQPTLDLATARTIARPLTRHERELVEQFEEGSTKYYFHPSRAPLYGVIVDGRLLSIAHSARRTSEACELGIDTLPEARRKGYALAATLLWAAAIESKGLIPFYSAFAENSPSLRLADAAGYRAFARGANIR